MSNLIKLGIDLLITVLGNARADTKALYGYECIILRIFKEII